MAALIIGVIVAGLGIGALVSAFQNRATVPELGATSIPQVTPVPQPPVTPLVRLTPTPEASPSPTDSPSSTPSPSPAPSRTPSPSPTPIPSATVAPTATAASSPSPSPLASNSVPSYAKPAAAVTAAPRPIVVATVVPALAPVVRPVVAPPNPPDAATALVRRYIDDLIAGDESGAYAALGGTSSDRSLSLKEEAFLDKDAHITSIHVSRADASGATIDAEITSTRGSYVATFHVTSGPNGAIINQHDYIKI